MHEQLDALLCTRYPAIFSAEGSVDQRLFGFECGDGWFPLIDGACELIQRHIESDGTQPLRALQVKQKFGGLRFYYQHGSDHAAAVVDLAESLSLHVCEICGAVGKSVQLFGWVQTRCPTHERTSVYEEPLLTKVRDELLLAPKMGELLGAALEFFAFDGQAAARWLTQRVAALGNVIPLALAGSEEGQRQVLTLIRRLEHGITP
ncbi:MbcA/ParS/Xre antitoxin family protein [Pseudomonas migulae]|uniref:MbcA/ParS/Xre antitoxin family protein n=1 Tax=Pseudomonas migulae TaxID=78543 RepID=A0ABY8MQN8_9PSED|nr:MbcA/ParS/Xre antitoxin family protein [Pseudomonas migulae]WGK89278.1 MbcA/ParS/Xre antitoxin family protein [Pseudomonas migulae]